MSLPESDIELLKLKAIEKISANLSHELRTPLAAIGAGVSILEDYFPVLYQAYQLARDNNLPVEPIYPDQFKKLEKVLQGMEGEIRLVGATLDMLLASTRLMDKPLQLCSISACVDEALQDYPFVSGQRELIQWKPGVDFNFLGNSALTIQVLLNLIKNALYSVRAARKGEIEIKLETKANYHILYCRDMGLGMSQETLAQLFDLFYSTTEHGNGLGLAFCKRVMKSYGGDISCDSVEGEYTQFELKFPKEVA